MIKFELNSISNLFSSSRFGRCTGGPSTSRLQEGKPW